MPGDRKPLEVEVMAQHADRLVGFRGPTTVQQRAKLLKHGPENAIDKKVCRCRHSPLSHEGGAISAGLARQLTKALNGPCWPAVSATAAGRTGGPFTDPATQPMGSQPQPRRSAGGAGKARPQRRSPDRMHLASLPRACAHSLRRGVSRRLFPVK